MLDLDTNWQSRQPLDVNRTRAKFRGGAYSDAQVDEFIQSLAHHCTLTGMAEAAVAGQIGKETGWFRYGGQVKPEQFNFAGIGSTNDGAAGHNFGTIDNGVRGVIAHHGNYRWGRFPDWPASWVPYQDIAIRNQQVLAAGYGGTVRVIGDMTNGRWAWTPGIPVGSLANGYATGIVQLGNSLAREGVMPATTPRIVDLRGSLPTSSTGGPRTRNGNKKGQVLHYSAVNYSASRTMEEILRSEAEYHCGPYLESDGIAYHFAIDWRQPVIYHLRDEDCCLWHCGYWGTPGNSDGLSIHVPGGSALVMEPAAVQALCWLLQRNEEKYGFGRNMLKGHCEVGSSTCPGPLMHQVVLPYRAGKISWEGGMPTGPVVDPVTGHTIHPELVDSYDFDTWGRPLLPAVLYSDGKIRQLFERGCFSPGRPEDQIETLGQAFLYVTGQGAESTVYPTWPGVYPLV